MTSLPQPAASASASRDGRVGRPRGQATKRTRTRPAPLRTGRLRTCRVAKRRVERSEAPRRCTAGSSEARRASLTPPDTPGRDDLCGQTKVRGSATKRSPSASFLGDPQNCGLSAPDNTNGQTTFEPAVRARTACAPEPRARPIASERQACSRSGRRSTSVPEASNQIASPI
jgi:hypothetical protein